MTIKLTREVMLAIGLIGCLLVYLILRAVNVPITYDEAATFFHYVHTGRFWPGEAHWDANNHVFNSLLTWLSYTVFGNSIVALRLPNLLAGLLYLIFAFKLSFRLDGKMLRWALFLSLVTSRLVLEFFALSRGYGLSMGLMLMAIYFLYGWMKTDRILLLLLASAGIQLATFSNLSLLLVNLLFFGWIIFWYVLGAPRNRLAIVAIQLMNVAAMYWLINLSFALKERGLLYYGSDEGDTFWKVTVSTLTEFTFDPWGDQLIKVMPVILLAVTISILLFLKKTITDKVFRLPEILFPYLFVGCIVGNILLHHLLGVNYPADRVALYYMILLPSALTFSLYAVAKNQRFQGWKKRSFQLMAVVLFIIPINFVFTANITHSTLWIRDASAQLFHEKLISIRQESELEPTVVGYRMRELPFNYYNVVNNGALSPLQWAGYRSDEADFQIAYLGVEADWSAYDTLLHDAVSDLYLLERKVKRERKLLFSKQYRPSKENADSFIEWFGADIDSLRGKDLLWDLEMEMPALKSPFAAWISVTVEDTLGQQIVQESIVLDRVRTSWNEGEVFRYHLIIPNIPEDSRRMKVFFWNIHNVPIKLGGVKIRLSEILDDSDKSSNLQQ
ncbi:MAG: hypothetical protein JKX84_04035 [Flavobacteriales bacterium]|nr:hypothetical protein [Flavobacteriales bacterium]